MGKPVPGPAMYQVGTQGGFLPAVAVHDNTTSISLDLISDPAKAGSIATTAILPTEKFLPARKKKYGVEPRSEWASISYMVANITVLLGQQIQDSPHLLLNIFLRIWEKVPIDISESPPTRKEENFL